VVWVGHRRLDCRRHPRPNEVWPIHIAAHAFAPGSPSRALRLSPDHAVFTGEVLIPVRYLVNGSTIAQVETDRVTYWHVELAQHDILLAENLPCESYLDTGNRDAFDNAPNFYNSSSAETASAPLPSRRPRRRLRARQRHGISAINRPDIPHRNPRGVRPRFRTAASNNSNNVSPPLTTSPG